MSSVFFRISNTDFLEAARVYDHPSKEFAIRIVSFGNGKENYVYLPEVTLNELSLLATILRLQLIPNYGHLADLRRKIVVLPNVSIPGVRYY